MALNPNPSLLDPGQIIKRVFDNDNDSIRTDANVTFNNTQPLEVAINQVDDNIAIGDGTHLYTSTTIGSDVALDVNISGGVVSGSFSQSGLKNGMRTTSFTITDTPQALPTSPLSGRNTLSVRVWGANVVYFGNSSVSAANGYPKKQYEEISMDVTDTAAVELYAVCDTGLTCEVRILEIA